MLCETLVTAVLSAYLGAAGDNAALYQGSLEPVFPQSLWVAHPYWKDAEFHQGSVCFDGNLYPSVQLRYNIYQNVLSVIAPESKIVVVPDQAKVDYFTMDNMLYVRRGERFVCVAYQGTNLSLEQERVKQKSADVVEGKVSKRNLSTKENFYLYKNDGSKVAVSNRRSLIKAYPEYRKELKKLCKENYLTFSEAARRQSLSYCLQYVDGLIGKGEESTSIGQEPQSEEPSVYLATTPMRSVPDSIFSAVEPATRVSAYYAYTPGSKVRLEYDEDDDLLVETPGVTDLEPLRESRTLDEVEVMGFRNHVAIPQGGMEAFRPSLLKNVPLVMGEADVLKLAMMLPGVSSTGEASSGLNVRGGASDQNLILYNGNTIYNPMHMFGLFSAFNSDLIAESELYKGGIPSQYGGRLSSVMNIKGRTADMQKFNGSVSIGLVTTKAVLDMPIVKDKVSLLLGGRTTYSDWMLKKMPAKSGYRDGSAGFWDLGGTLHISINRNHSLNLNGYYSNDRFSFTKDDQYNYVNRNFSGELRSRFGERWSSVLTLGTDGYEYNNDNQQHELEGARLSFSVNQLFAKDVATYQLNDAHSLNFGLSVQLEDVMPGKYQALGKMSWVVDRKLDNEKALEAAAWAEDTWKVDDQWSVTGGVRLNLFKADKKGLEKTYIQPDWRLSLKYDLNDNNSIKAGFNTLHQYIHKVSNTVIMSPTDTWVLSNGKIKPQEGWQGSLGWYLQSPDMVYEFSVEGYYKKMDNYLTYRSGANLVMNPELYKDVIGMHGRAYGIEFQIRKMTGKLNGWINYTYSRSQMRQEGRNQVNPINDGDWVNMDYDTPHDVKFVGNYKFTRRYSTSLNFNYKTGRPFTAPAAIFYNEHSQIVAPLYLKRNDNRMPDYMRVDWSFNIEPGHHLTAKTHRWLTLGVYNLLGRKNAYSIYYESEGWNVQGYKLSIFGAPIPYITYNIKF